MGRNPKKAGKKAKPKAGKAGGGGGEKMTSADDSDFELEDGVTVVTGATDDEMDERIRGTRRAPLRTPHGFMNPETTPSPSPCGL